MIASTVASASVPSNRSNTSDLSNAIRANASYAHEPTVLDENRPICVLPHGAVTWWSLEGSSSSHGCLGEPYQNWAMLKSYRSGGTEKVHWKYTEDGYGCLEDWTWHAEDGTRVVAKIKGRLAVERDGRHWCGLPMYRSGGVEGKQWAWCTCWGK